MTVPADPPCWAPTRVLHVLPDGAVRPCCISVLPVGNVRRQSLHDAWFGPQRVELGRRMAEADFSLGCTGCEAELRTEGPEHAYPRQFDRFARRSADDEPWPAMLGLYFANTCNLQCVQCNGEWSSSIRRHREHKPPLRASYDGAFFDELREFLAHADHVLFAGGEPFLIPEVLRTLALIKEVGADPSVAIITNGTQWNDKVEAAIDGLRTTIIVSIDGATAPTFEAIRVGARFDEVLANLDRFIGHARRTGTAVEINHCLMTANHHEFADLLLLAEDRGVRVNTSVVREPAAMSLAALGADELRAVHRALADRHDEVAARLQLNRGTWDAELARIAAWAARPPGTGAGGPSDQTIVLFPVVGDGPTSDDEARATLAATAADGVVHEVTVGIGDRIVALSPSIEAVLQIDAGGLDGRPAADLWEAMTSRFGRSRSFEEVARDADLAVMEASFGGVSFVVRAVPLRDRSGRAHEVRLLLARRDEG